MSSWGSANKKYLPVTAEEARAQPRTSSNNLLSPRPTPFSGCVGNWRWCLHHRFKTPLRSKLAQFWPLQKPEVERPWCCMPVCSLGLCFTLSSMAAFRRNTNASVAIPITLAGLAALYHKSAGVLTQRGLLLFTCFLWDCRFRNAAVYCRL